MSYYIEECRIQKYFFDVQLNTLNTSNQIFNNFLYGTEYYTNSNNVTGDHPFLIFNALRVARLRLIRKYYIQPVYTYSIEHFYSSIIHFWKNCNKLYTALLVILILLLTTFYLLYWKPFELKLDKDIYKTKNMLSIIPKEVIASFKNIGNLLNLGTSITGANANGNENNIM